MTDRAINPDEKVLALATKRSIQAAGGLEVCEQETPLSDSQLSRCCSVNHRDSITIRDVAVIDALAGYPHILHALARVIGGVVVIELPSAADDPDCLVQSILELTTELGDVSGAVASSLRGDSAGGTIVTSAEAGLALEHLDDLDRASARLRRKLERIAKGDAPSG